MVEYFGFIGCYAILSGLVVYFGITLIEFVSKKYFSDQKIDKKV